MRPFLIRDLLNHVDVIETYWVNPQALISQIVYDSRQVWISPQSIFVALQGSLSDGHQYIDACYKKGIRTFLISDKAFIGKHEANYILVANTLHALQQIATWYRDQFDLLMVGITGSKGKTTIKEWLSHMLSLDYNVVKSPKSFNSQLGVPIAMFEIEPTHKIGVFEAGISKVGEMEHLAKIIQPNVGIMTNIGPAHSAGFEDLAQKISEKLRLFKNAKTIIYCKDHIEIDLQIQELSHVEAVSWGYHEEASLFTLQEIIKSGQETKIVYHYQGKDYTIWCPLSDDGSVENALHCLAFCLWFGVFEDNIRPYMASIFNLPMRLEVVEGQQDSTIIVDTYNHDLISLQLGLQQLEQLKNQGISVAVVSDFVDQKLTEQEQQKLTKILANSSLDKIIWVGNKAPHVSYEQAASTQDATNILLNLELTHATILLKGARKFAFENIKTSLQRQSQSSCLSIDLQAFDHNIQVYSRLIQSTTGIIAIIKAGAYGTGSEKLGRILQYRGIQYLAVAQIDEGVALRKAGIHLPIIVLNPDHHGFDTMHKYKLEPEVYSLYQLRILAHYLMKSMEPLNIHLKLDTGMNRLGFKEEDLPAVAQIINASMIQVKTVFSHLVGSESSTEDDYTHMQFQRFEQYYEYLVKHLGFRPARHILNTAGILRFPSLQCQYVRLGIGMYGIDTTQEIKASLEKVHTFYARIIQIKWAEEGEKVGYNQRGHLKRKSKLAIVNVGYADGLPRAVGNGKYALFVQGRLAPIIGNVCMDLTIIDITDIESCQEGDIVEIFGKNLPIEALAKLCETIPYELLSRISPRVRREWYYS